MSVIYKYELPPQGDIVLDIPSNSTFLSLAVQNGKPVTWWLNEASENKVERHLKIVMTGERFNAPEGFSFLGTFQIETGEPSFPYYVGHVFLQ